MDSESQKAAAMPPGEASSRSRIVPQPHTPASESMPLSAGSLVCAGRYRLICLLHRRPRVHLYLAQRLTESMPAHTRELPLVAIRELVLTNLDSALRQQIIDAALEEFAATQFFGSPHLTGVGDRLHVENDRHYLVMQPRSVAGPQTTFAVPLSELLVGEGQGPDWLTLKTALNWGLQLCQVVARLHNRQYTLGELTPETLLVGRDGNADWIPILLAYWPPSPFFWSGGKPQERITLSMQVFPLLEPDAYSGRPARSIEQSVRPFAAPETLVGQRDKRSDVYALGAILYLLLTRHMPVAASQRLRAGGRARLDTPPTARKTGRQAARTAQGKNQTSPSLPSPRVLNGSISVDLETILLRALALDPQQRFASVLDLAEALTDVASKSETMPKAKISHLRKLLDWLSKERQN
jgi:hypothetical protein